MKSLESLAKKLRIISHRQRGTIRTEVHSYAYVISFSKAAEQQLFRLPGKPVKVFNITSKSHFIFNFFHCIHSFEYLLSSYYNMSLS